MYDREHGIQRLERRVFTITFLLFPLAGGYACGRVGAPLPRVIPQPPPPQVVLVGRWDDKILIRLIEDEKEVQYRFYRNLDRCSPPQTGEIVAERWEGWYSFSTLQSGAVEFLKGKGVEPSPPWLVPSSADSASADLSLQYEITPQGEILFTYASTPRIYLEQKKGGEWIPLGIKLLPINLGVFPPKTFVELRYLLLKDTNMGWLFVSPLQEINIMIP